MQWNFKNSNPIIINKIIHLMYEGNIWQAVKQPIWYFHVKLTSLNFDPQDFRTSSLTV